MDDNKQTTPVVDATPSTTTTVEDKKGGNAKTFTQDEVNAIVSKRLAEEDAKTEAKIKELIKQERTEAERLANLTAEEKAKEERKKRDAEIEAKERDITLREMRIEAKDMLIQKHIPIELVDFVVDLDANKTKENIEKLAKTFNKSVEDGVTNKLKGTPIEDFSNSNNQKDNVKKPVNTAF